MCFYFGWSITSFNCRDVTSYPLQPRYCVIGKNAALNPLLSQYGRCNSVWSFFDPNPLPPSPLPPVTGLLGKITLPCPIPPYSRADLEAIELHMRYLLPNLYPQRTEIMIKIIYSPKFYFASFYTKIYAKKRAESFSIYN